MSEKDNVLEDGVLCRSEYDIDDNGNVCTGRTTLRCQDGKYFLEIGKEDENPKFSYEVDTLKRLSIVSNIGCANLEAEFKDGEAVRLCRMTHSINLMTNALMICRNPAKFSCVPLDININISFSLHRMERCAA